MTSTVRKCVRLAVWIACACVMSLSPAAAHTVWLVKAPDGPQVPSGQLYQMLFGGHEGKLEGYPAHKLKTVRAMSKGGEDLPVWQLRRDNDVRLWVEGEHSVILVHFDNGIYTRTADGDSVNLPMSAVEEPVSGVSAVKYHKTIAAWSALAAKAQGQPFEVVPLSALQPKAGQPMQVRVLIDGAPAAGLGIGTGETNFQSTTNEDGIGTFTPVKGFNALWAGKRSLVKGNPDYTELSIEYRLGFYAD